MLTAEEQAKLEARNEKLAKEKAYLQLVIELMNQLSAKPGLENTVHNMLNSVAECIGSTDVILYFIIDDDILRAGLFDEIRKVDHVDDELVAEVFSRRQPVTREHDFKDTMLLTPEFIKAWTWAFPLWVGDEMLGVFKIENLHMGVSGMDAVLPTFFKFAALLLKNEIHSHTRLQQANDALSKANAELIEARCELEQQVEEQTRASQELSRVNDELVDARCELEQQMKEQIRAGEALAASNAELEQANHQLEAFSYSVSHDLRAPLRAIDGFARILVEEHKDRLDADGQRCLTVVLRNAERMGRLIDDLLAFSRASKQDLVHQDVDMNALVHEVFDELQEAAPDRLAVLETAGLPRCCCDRTMMRQVFVNLLGNALKFSARAASPKIEVGCTVSGDNYVFHVKDNGAGFDMQHADRLFGVFQRLHSNEDFEGTGIGLAIVQRVIDRHGGKAWAEGRVGEGATIYFTLPRQASPA